MLAVLLFFTSAKAFALSLEEIAKRGTVRIGVLIGGPPMGMVDEKGNPTGYDYDVAVLVAKYLGVKAEFVPLTPPARIPALQTGKVDFLISTLNPTPERAKTVMFTMPYNAFNMVIVSSAKYKIAKMEELAGKRVAANRGSPQEAALRKAAVPGSQVVVFEDRFDGHPGIALGTDRCSGASRDCRQVGYATECVGGSQHRFYDLLAGELDGGKNGRS